MGVSGAVLYDYYPYIAGPLIGDGWFTPSKGALHTVVYGEDAQTFHDLEWDPERKQYRYFARSMGWVQVDPSRLKSYVVDVDRFIDLLHHHLRIPRSHRITCLHDGLLWHLGPARFSGVRAHLYFARCLGNPHNREPLRQAMGLEREKSPAIILHGGRTNPTWLDLPADQLIVPLRTVCGRDGNEFSIDKDLLRARLLRQPSAPENKGAVLDFSSDYRTVYWYGKTYSLTKKQAAMVRCLNVGSSRAHGDVLAAAADTDQTVAQIMRNKRNRRNTKHPLYGTLIKGDGSGYFHLDREASPPDS